MMSNKSDMWDVIISSEDDGVLLLQKALETYEPKGSLFKYLLRRILNEAKNRTRKLDASIHKGERTYHSSYTDSIDAPVGSDEDGSAAFELESEPAVDNGRERAKHILSYVLSVLGNRLSKSQRNLLIAIKDMGDDAFSPDGELVYGLIANRTGLSDSNVGSTMSSVKKMAKQLREKGEV
jgi:DNA-directed RNA polymerase specialized sigma24 family protein